MMVGVRKYFGKFLPTAWACSFSWKDTILVFAGFSLASLSPVFAQSSATDAQVPASSSSAPANRPPPCSNAENRAFDFWIGEWDVTAKGQNAPTAVNRISAQHAGCVIREDYTTKGGYTGMSMSFYDAARKTWHQTWMGVDGSALFIEGGPNAEGAMVLSNKNWPGYVDGSPINRVTWTPNEDGSVRQHWQSSSDGGKSWTDVFDGLYVKRADTPD